MEALREHSHPPDIRTVKGGSHHPEHLFVGYSGGYHLVIGGLDSRLHSAYIQSDGIQDKSSFLLTKHLHHVSARIHEDVHITSFEVGAHTVGYDAAQTVEALAHVHRFVVQPVLHRAIQTKHCSLILSLAGALQSCFPGCA